jgi:hypothetical protein
MPSDERDGVAGANADLGRDHGSSHECAPAPRDEWERAPITLEAQDGLQSAEEHRDPKSAKRSDQEKTARNSQVNSGSVNGGRSR